MTAPPRVRPPRDDGERRLWLRLSRTESVGSITFFRLLERFGDAETALRQLPDLARRGGRTAPPRIPKPAEIDREVTAVQRLGGRHVAYGEAGYPQLLRHIEDPPPLLTCLGHAGLLDRPTVAIIGARNASINGRRLAEDIAAGCAAGGYTVVSGFARGIDTAAHRGSLDQGTVAVLPGGLDVVYPKENAALFDDVAARGLILAEMPPGTQPQARFFAQRNRIIAGMSLGVVIVEAAQRSGSLMTARLANDYGREIMGVPGSPLDPRAYGPNRLIQQGAALVQTAEDVLAVLHDLTPPTVGEGQGDLFTAPPPPEPPAEALATARAQMIECLSPTPCSVDEVIRACQVTAAVAQTVLLELELAGRVARLPGNRVHLIA